MEGHYFFKGSKDSGECSKMEKDSLKSLLKEELTIFTRTERLKITLFRGQDHNFVASLGTYLINREIYNGNSK